MPDYAYHVIIRVSDFTKIDHPNRDYEFVADEKPSLEMFSFLCDKVLVRHMRREGRTDAHNFKVVCITSGYVEKLDVFLNS